MTAPHRPFGVQSYCFRHFRDNAAVAQRVKQCGLASIELCAVHADFDRPETFDGVIGTYRDAGIEILSIGVETFTGDEAADRRRFEFAKAAGAGFISVHFEPDTYLDAIPAAAKLADAYGIRLAIHNHGGYHWLGSEQMLAHILKTSPPSIGLCLDTAWCLDAKGDPVKWVERFGDRLYGLHLKDFVFDRARQHQDVVVGTGNVDVPALYRKLAEVDFAGYAVLEYEADVENPVPALTRCAQAVADAAGQTLGA